MEKTEAGIAMAFVFGAIASVAAGFSGMRAATSANGRTAMAAKNGGNQPPEVSYNGGAVMGLSVGGLAWNISHCILARQRLW